MKMQPCAAHKPMRFSLFHFFLVAFGVGGMLLSACFDLLFRRVEHFGMNQLAGFVVSTLVVLAGLRKMALYRQRGLEGILLAVYLAGILFMGLRPDGHNLLQAKAILAWTGFSESDFIINIMGFIPLGYLMMSYFGSHPRLHHHHQRALAAMVLLCGLALSLGIELIQVDLPGRCSSLYDLLANGLGMLGGVAYGLMEKRFSPPGD
jgi:hypothetical protein